jgi:hypothetical protein
MAYIKASIGGIRLISGHQLEGYDGLYQGIKTEGYGLCWAPTEAIWRILGHQVKGYGLWEGTKLRYLADIGHLLKVNGLC